MGKSAIVDGARVDGARVDAPRHALRFAVGASLGERVLTSHMICVERCGEIRGALALHEDCAVCFCEILFQSATKRVVKEPGDESSALKMLESVSSAIVSCGGGGATFGNVGDDVGDFRGVGEVLRVFSDERVGERVCDGGSTDGHFSRVGDAFERL